MYHSHVPFSRCCHPFKKGDVPSNVQSNIESCEQRKREGPKPLSPKKSLFIWVLLLPEVALEETCEGLAVSCLVAGHFVDGVMNGVEIQFLGALGEGGLAGGGAVLGLHPHLIARFARNQEEKYNRGTQEVSTAGTQKASPKAGRKPQICVHFFEELCTLFILQATSSFVLCTLFVHFESEYNTLEKAE